jgi:hypothetical protein
MCGVRSPHLKQNDLDLAQAQLSHAPYSPVCSSSQTWLLLFLETVSDNSVSSGNCPYCSYKIPTKMLGTHPWPSCFIRSAWQQTHIAKLNILHYIQGYHAHTSTETATGFSHCCHLPIVGNLKPLASRGPHCTYFKCECQRESTVVLNMQYIYKYAIYQ